MEDNESLLLFFLSFYIRCFPFAVLSLKRQTKVFHQGTRQAHTACRTRLISTGIKNKFPIQSQSHQLILNAILSRFDATRLTFYYF